MPEFFDISCEHLQLGKCMCDHVNTYIVNVVVNAGSNVTLIISKIYVACLCMLAWMNLQV